MRFGCFDGIVMRINIVIVSIVVVVVIGMRGRSLRGGVVGWGNLE